MISLLLCFVRATRERNWPLHLECVREMIPAMFAYNHTNYSRYLPLYLCQMKCLDMTHPEANDLLSRGEFGVQRSKLNRFGRLAVDQTIEQTLNQDTKTKGAKVDANST